MTGTFRARATFVIESRQFFVIHGDMVSGVVRPGMTVCLSPTDAELTAAPIHAVESVDYVQSRTSEIGLVIRYENAERLHRLRSLSLEGRLLEILDPLS